jgi:hypothetical protein
MCLLNARIGEWFGTEQQYILYMEQKRNTEMNQEKKFGSSSRPELGPYKLEKIRKPLGSTSSRRTTRFNNNYSSLLPLRMEYLIITPENFQKLVNSTSQGTTTTLSQLPSSPARRPSKTPFMQERFGKSTGSTSTSTTKSSLSTLSALYLARPGSPTGSMISNATSTTKPRGPGSSGQYKATKCFDCTSGFKGFKEALTQCHRSLRTAEWDISHGTATAPMTFYSFAIGRQ